MLAAILGHTDCARLLVDAEARMQNHCGWTALMWAAENGREECVALLLEKEGGMRSEGGSTALDQTRRCRDAAAGERCAALLGACPGERGRRE